MRWNEDEGKSAAPLEVGCVDHPTGRLVGGLVLMTVGAIFLLGRLDVIPGHAMSTYWPLVVVAVGLGKLLQPSERRRPGNATWLIFIGLWAQATVLHWFGLTWQNSWPIVLIFIGLRVLVTEVIGKGRVRDAQ
jgi:lia operon protein LiaF